MVDGLLAGLLQTKSMVDTVVVTSDHGNSEDLTTRVHTLNSVPLLVFGPAAPRFANVHTIEALTPTMLEILKGA
jgi:bisphosphoglycerate-independent phosphoglycerate mutase (AlkP superfamily)